jgi:CRP-like cAMP-binding protein
LPACPLRALKLFHEPTGEELELVQSLKRRERRLGAGESLIHEGQTDAPLYTLLQGWAFRYKTLSDGRRQILSFLLAGDFIGVQQKMGDAAAHGVETLTDALFCVFQRDALWELHRRSPMMGFNVTWLTAHEESMVDDTLLSVGRRSAEERIASMLILLFKRAGACRPTRARAACVSADAAAHRRRAGAVAGAHQQDTAQARAARPAPHRRRPALPARRQGHGPAGRPVRRRPPAARPLV